MFTRLAHVSAAALASLAAAAICEASPVLFPVSQGGNGNAYEVVLDGDATADAAGAAAAARGGHLVTITSADEQSFIESLLVSTGAPTGSYWLDLRREAGDVVWGTGEPFDYANLADGEPNNLLGKETHGQLYWSGTPADDLLSRRGRWNDVPVTGYPNADNPGFPTPDLGRAGFIVEREAAPPTAIPLPAGVLTAPVTALLAAVAARRMCRRMRPL